MDLDADEPVHLAAGGIVIDQHAHQAAVEHLLDGIAAGDEPQGVPAIAVDELLQLLAIAQRKPTMAGFLPSPI